MTFLNPSLLFALPAVSLPVLIHFFARQRARLLPFSTLRFLHELEHSEIRRFRLREIILLVLRTLAVLVAILAFARPALVPPQAKTGALGSRIASAVVLDDSYSLSAYTAKGTYFERACDRVEAIAGTLGPDDAGTVIRPRGTRAAYQAFPLRAALDAETGQWAWAASPDGPYDNDLTEGMTAAIRWLARFPDARREIFLVSDFAGEIGLDSALVARAEGARLYFVPLPEEELANLSITRLELDNRILEPGALLTINVAVRNTGSLSLEDRLVQLFLEGQPVAQTTVSLAPGETETLNLRAIPSKAGWQRGAVVLEDDALRTDNTMWFVLNVPGRLRVLIVAPTERDARPVQLALSAGGAESGLFAVTVKSPAEVVNQDVRGSDAIFLCNVAALNPVTRDEVLEFVRRGGTLALFMGSNVDPRWLSQELLAPLDLPPFAGVVGKAGAIAPALTFGRIDLQHPIFQGVFEDRVKVSSPLIYMALKPLMSERIRPIIEYSDGSPFLFEAAAGRGRVFVFTTGLDPSWSDVARRGIFVPLANRIPIYGKSIGEGQELYTLVGEPISLLDQRLTLGATYEMERPDGVRVRLEPEARPGGIYLEFTDTTVPGVYRLLLDGRPVRLWAVNPDPAEADLARVDLSRLARSFGATVMSPGGDVAKALALYRRGRELWPILALALFLILLAESIVARSPEAESEAGNGGRKRTVEQTQVARV